MGVPSEAVALPRYVGVVVRRVVVGLSLTATLALPANAAAEACDCHVVTAWSSANGLPAHNILSITQDHDGFLWLGTDGGLIRFDGLRFDLWDVPEAPLAGNSVSVVMTARDGSLWIGFNDSRTISRIKDGRVLNYERRAGLERSVVLTIIEDRSGTVWAGGRSGLGFFRENQWHVVDQRLGLLPETEVTSLYEDRRGDLWIGTSMGIFHRSGEHPRFTLLDSSSTFVQAFAEDPTGTIWITDTQQIVKPLKPRQGLELTAGIQLPAGGYRIIPDRNSNLWIAALGEGLLRVRTHDRGRRVIERFRYEHKIAGGARSLFVDREQNIWVGLRTGGLVRLSESAITTNVKLEGLTNDGVRALVTAGDGSVWIAGAQP